MFSFSAQKFIDLSLKANRTTKYSYSQNIQDKTTYDTLEKDIAHVNIFFGQSHCMGKIVDQSVNNNDWSTTGISIFCKNWVFIEANNGIFSLFYKNAIWDFIFMYK